MRQKLSAGRSVAICICCILTACATPAPQIVTKEVRIPVAIACVDRTAIPVEPVSVALPLDARLAADIAAAQALSYKAWGRSLYALIQPCTK